MALLAAEAIGNHWLHLESRFRIGLNVKVNYAFILTPRYPDDVEHVAHHTKNMITQNFIHYRTRWVYISKTTET